MKRRLLWIAALLLTALAGSAAADQPNIILILSDDFGYGDAGPYGGGPGPRHAHSQPRPAVGRGHDLLLVL